MSTLLIVDDKTRMYLKIIGAAKPTTTVIVFNRSTSSLDDIVKQIEALPNRAFTSVGLVQDGTDRMMNYRIVKNQTPCSLRNLKVDGLASWSPVIAFLQSVKSLTGMATFDFISCLLNSNPGFSYAISQISTQLGVVLQASSDRTGNLAQGGNWIQESDNVNIKDVYFTDSIVGYTGLLYMAFRKQSNQLITASNTGLVSDTDGKRVLGMTTFSSVKITNVDYNIDLPEGFIYTAIASTVDAFAALTADHRIFAWGDPNNGGKGVDGAGAFLEDSTYTAIASTDMAFAALTADHRIFAWGDPYAGGKGVGGVGDFIVGSNYTEIASSNYVFVALTNDGSIFTWGGGETYSYPRTFGKPVDSTYIAIASTSNSFAALTADHRIFAWGHALYGGKGTNRNGITVGTGGFLTGSNYTAISSNNAAFAALTTDKTVYVWGAKFSGGLGGNPLNAIGTGDFIVGYKYTAIASSDYSFAALNSDDGLILKWVQNYSHSIDNSHIYTAIVSNNSAFAALTTDKTVFAWGDPSTGVDSVGALIEGSNYTTIASSAWEFAALNTDGRIFVWNSSDSKFIAGSGYTAIVSNDYSFVAISSFTAITSVVACFVKGTRLLSQNGYKPIDKFSKKDFLITSDGRTIDFKLASTTIAKTDESTAPYVIQPHAFGHNSPIAPLYLSPTHKIMIKKGVWISPRDVVKTNPLVQRCAIGESVTYYHVECENYLRDNVIAEGMVSESYGTTETLKGVTNVFKWNARLKGDTRKGTHALLKNKV